MTSKIIKKVGIVISSTRELDMYNNLLKELPYNKFSLIINDLSISQNDRFVIAKSAKNFKNKLFLSKIYKKKKYSVILSTGEIYNNKISIYSLFRFFYAVTIGNLIESSVLKKIFIKVFNKPYSAGGLNCSLGLPWYPEKNIGIKIIRFPDGADSKLKISPLESQKKIFDLFLYFTDYEGNELQKKITKKKIKKITYFRYQNCKKKKINFSFNFKNQGFDNKKKIIYWLPTFVDTFGEKNKNIELWIPKLLFLKKFYNLIIRPHPKSNLENSILKEKLIFHNLIVDDKLDQKIGNIIISSDIIFCDYGDAIFSSLYLNKPIILLNFLKDSYFVRSLVNVNSLDIKTRGQFINLNLSCNQRDIHESVENCLNNNFKKNILKCKKNIFGNKKADNASKLAKILLKNIY